MKKTAITCTFFCICIASYAQITEQTLYSGWQCHNLKGEVKTMITSAGDTLCFDRQGELTDEKGKRLLDMSEEFNYPFKVSFPDEYTRYETNQREAEARKRNWYIFDHKGRIVRSVLLTYATRFETTYLYSLWEYDSEFEYRESEFPWRVIVDDGDEDFSTFYITEYYYKTFDEKGNWTERSVRSWKLYTDNFLWEGIKPTMETDMREYSESAQYTYY